MYSRLLPGPVKYQDLRFRPLQDPPVNAKKIRQGSPWPRQVYSDAAVAVEDPGLVAKHFLVYQETIIGMKA